MHSSYTTTSTPTSFLNEGIIMFVEILVVIGVYIYLRTRVKNNEMFSGMGWGFFAGIFMGGLGDIIFYVLMSNLLTKHIIEWNKGKFKRKQDKNWETLAVLKRKLGTGLALSFIVHLIIRLLLFVR